MRSKSLLGVIPAALVAILGLAACGTAAAAPATAPPDVRLGYFPNITHATALVGVANGTYARELGSLGGLKIQTFNAGPAAVEALFSGAIDMSYVGPDPATNAYVQSHGTGIRIIRPAGIEPPHGYPSTLRKWGY